MKPCNVFKQFESGEVTAEYLENHIQGCDACRLLKQQDDQLMALASGLNTAIPVPDLWPEIEANLSSETTEKTQPKIRFRLFYNNRLFQLAATLLIFASLTAVYFAFDQMQKPSGLLSQSAVERVETTEAQYVSAIAELEIEAGKKLTQMDLHLMLLYRDKLETIETQIEQCKLALNDNPANSHIRRYMLAALIDKKEALQEIIEFKLES